MLTPTSKRLTLTDARIATIVESASTCLNLSTRQQKRNKKTEKDTMGQDVEQSHFHKKDYTQFEKRLREETKLLMQWSKEEKLTANTEEATEAPTIGLELELCLVDDEEQPKSVAADLVPKLHKDGVTHELAQFQLEYNSPVFKLQGNAFSLMHRELIAFSKKVQVLAKEHGANPVAIGILPTLHPEDMSLQNMFRCCRYRALNEQLMHFRKGEGVHLHIEGEIGNHHGRSEVLDLDNPTIMLEACSTSFQLHLQVPPLDSCRTYNAILVASSILVALTANSPALFGKSLWDESRIAVMEQSVDFRQTLPRVWFASGYCKGCLSELFEENLKHEVIMPVELSENNQDLAHLRVHNGSLWRWVRPVVELPEDGHAPSIRIEQRCMPSGPTLVDTIGNAIFYCGLVKYLTDLVPSVEEQLTFENARSNFYAAAKGGLEAKIIWFDGKESSIQHLLQQELLAAVRFGLGELDIDEQDMDKYLDVIEKRARSGQTGATWQRRWIQKHGVDMSAMTAAYRKNQSSGQPVAEWSV